LHNPCCYALHVLQARSSRPLRRDEARDRGDGARPRTARRFSFVYERAGGATIDHARCRPRRHPRARQPTWVPALEIELCGVRFVDQPSKLWVNPSRSKLRQLTFAEKPAFLQGPRRSSVLPCRQRATRVRAVPAPYQHLREMTAIVGTRMGVVARSASTNFVDSREGDMRPRIPVSRRSALFPT